MAYSMWSHGSRFFLAKENIKPACEAGRRVLKDVSSNKNSEGQQLVDMFLELGFLPIFDKAGNIEELRFEGDRLMDDMKPFFQAISQYVQKDSYLDLQGEDFTQWRWLFVGDHMEELFGQVVYA